MRSNKPRPDRARALYENPSAAALLRARTTSLPPEAGRWLGQLALLHGLPFELIVPDARMLPEESLRFFFIDQNWLDALIDGALSVVAAFDGHHATAVDLRRDGLRAKARASAKVDRRVRRVARRGGSPEARAALLTEPDPISPPIWTGMLLRSAAVLDWPGLEVRAFSDAEGTAALPALRVDRPSPSVLFAIFDGVGRRFDIAMPRQSLHFGLEETGEGGSFQLAVRGLGGAIPSGKQVEGEYSPVKLRTNAGARKVVDVSGTHDALTSAIARVYGQNPAPPVRAGAFGLELVAGSARQSFFDQTSPPVRGPERTAETERAAPASLFALIEELDRHG